MEKDSGQPNLPGCVLEYIDAVVRRVRFSRKVRREVRQELIDHFEDALRDCANQQQRQQRAEDLIQQFGEAKLLGTLIRRGKKRCRPLWKKALIRSFQTLLICYLLILPYNAWILSTWRGSKVDYLQRFNALNRPAGASERDNALPYYERAAKLYVQMPKDLADAVYRRRSAGASCRTRLAGYETLSAAEKRRLDNWIDANERPWQALVEGTHRRYCWQSLKGFLPQQVDLTEFPSSLSELCSLGRWKARRAVARGRFESALDHWCTLMRFSDQIMQSKLFIVYLTGVAISSRANADVLEFVSKYSPDDQWLAEAQRRLAGAYGANYPLYDPRGEAIFSLGGMASMFELTGSSRWMCYVVPRELILRRPQKQAEARALSVANALVGKRPYELRGFAATEEKVKVPVSDMLFDMMVGSIMKGVELSWRGKAFYEAVPTVLTLKRWRLAKGEYPSGLQELVDGGYLKSLPADPYSDGPLKYHRRGDDFVLYSVGADFDDDGGVQGERSWGDREGGGDRVFWPID